MSQDIRTSLQHRFHNVLTERAFSLFVTLINYAEQFETAGDDIICFFPEADEEETLTIYGPVSTIELAAIKDKVPPNYLLFLSVCGGMLYGESGETSQVALHPGFDGTLHCLRKDLFSDYTEALFSPIDIGYQIVYFLNPATNQLCILDEGIEEVTIGNDPVEVYLKELHYKFRNYEKDYSFKVASHRSTWLREIEK